MNKMLPDYPISTQCFIFDIDGTIADCNHRVHHLSGARKNWAAFNAAMVNDTPIESTIEVMNALSHNYAILLLTGRSEETRDVTEAWLSRHGISADCLLMRGADDFRKDWEMKEDFVSEIKDKFDVHGAFDDSEGVLAMLNRHGIRTFDCSQTN